MIPYILHVTVITTVCFLFYKLLLQKETFYQLNRWTLLSCLAVAFSLPLLPAPRDWSLQDALAEAADRPVAPPVVEKMEPVASEVSKGETAPTVSKPAAPVAGPTAVRVSGKRSAKGQQVKVLPEKITGEEGMVNQPVAAAGTPATPSSVESKAVKPAGTAVAEGAKPAMAGNGKGIAIALKGLFYCYLFGVLLFGVNFLLQMAVLLYQSYCRPVIRDGRFRIVEVSGNRAPCSFGNTIFINPGNYDWETFNQILIHEKVHVSGRHTVDILLAEIALVLQWFNPFAWLYRREVENNLEFLPADRNGRMRLRLTGIYSHGPALFFRLRLNNRSSLDYDIDSIRFCIAAAPAKHHAQDKPAPPAFLKPIYIYDSTGTVPGNRRLTTVFALPRFTLPPGRQLLIMVSERNGGRGLQVQTTNFWLERARPI